MQAKWPCFEMFSTAEYLNSDTGLVSWNSSEMMDFDDLFYEGVIERYYTITKGDILISCAAHSEWNNVGCVMFGCELFIRRIDNL